MFCRRCGEQLNRKTNVHQAHWGQQIQKSGLQLLPSPLTRLMQIGVDAIPFQPLLELDSLQSFQLGSESTLRQTFTKGIATVDQSGKVKTLLALQSLEIDEAALNPVEMIWIALQREAVLIQGSKQPFNHRLHIQSLVSQGFQGGIELGHRLKLLNGNGQVFLQRRRLVRSVAQPSEQAGKPLLQPNPVDKTILLLLQQQLFAGIIQLCCFELLEELILFRTFLFTALLLLLTSPQGRR